MLPPGLIPAFNSRRWDEATKGEVQINIDDKKTKFPEGMFLHQNCHFMYFWVRSYKEIQVDVNVEVLSDYTKKILNIE